MAIERPRVIGLRELLALRKPLREVPAPLVFFTKKEFTRLIAGGMVQGKCESPPGQTCFGSEHIEAADFRNAFDQARSLVTEAFLNAGHWEFRVFDHVMEKRGGERGRVHLHVRENVRDLEKMGEIGFAGAAKLVAVAFGCDVVSAANQPRVVGRAVIFEFIEELCETSVEQALGAVPVEVERQIGRP